GHGRRPGAGLAVLRLPHDGPPAALERPPRQLARLAHVDNDPDLRELRPHALLRSRPRRAAAQSSTIRIEVRDHRRLHRPQFHLKIGCPIQASLGWDGPTELFTPALRIHNRCYKSTL